MLIKFTGMPDRGLGPIRTETIRLPLQGGPQYSVDVLRLDLLHPVISGNKWFKLQYYIRQAVQENKQSVITFGGPWSNHIVATAAVCKEKNLQAYGIIRGEEPRYLSQALADAAEYGMQLVYTSRDAYRKNLLPSSLNELVATDHAIVIPQGGYGAAGLRGAATMADLFDPSAYDQLFCAAGTGTMVSGIMQATGTKSAITAISVLKNNFELEKNINSLLQQESIASQHQINHSFHFGGYAKFNQRLLAFMNELYAATGIPTDFVYSGKLFYAVNAILQQGQVAEKNKFLVIHSGGLQGNRSLKKGTLIF
ncbi:MAG: pyridoxal-phosphate dependent enzyme [Terrimonas sp.]|nr:pyridoxal-phosphate dependent enzyme [Terrimonas sp.]